MSPSASDPEATGNSRPGSRWGLVLLALLLAGLLLVWLVLPILIPDWNQKPPAASRRVGDWEVTPLGELRFRSDSPDRHRLLVACASEAPQLWDTEAGKRVAVLHRHRGDVSVCSWSPDGSSFATAQKVGPKQAGAAPSKLVRSIYLWDTATGKFLKEIPVDLSAEEVRDSTDWNLRWLDEATLLLDLHTRWRPRATSFRTVFARLDVNKGTVAGWSLPVSIGEHLDLSPDGTRAVATKQAIIDSGEPIPSSCTAHLVDLVNLTVLATLDRAADMHLLMDGNTFTGHAVWSPDSRRGATVSQANILRIWAGRTGKPVAELVGHTDRVRHVSFSPDGERVLTTSDDDTARLWEAATGKQAATLDGPTLDLSGAIFDSTGKWILTGSGDQTARLWDAVSGKQLRTWPDHEDRVKDLAFLAGGTQIRTRTIRGVVRTWSVETGALLSEENPPRHDRNQHGNCFLRPDSEWGRVAEMWVGPPGAVPPVRDRWKADERYSTLWWEAANDVPTAQLPGLRRTLTGHRGTVHTVAYSADGRTLVSAEEDQKVIVWNPDGWDVVTGRGRTILRPPVRVRTMALAPDGRTLAFGGEDGMVGLWDVAQRKERLALKRHENLVTCLAFSPDSTALASGGSDETVKVWDLTQGKERWSVTPPLGHPEAVAFSPDGKQLAVGGTSPGPGLEKGEEDRQASAIVLLDAADGTERRRLKGHTDSVSVLAITPDGKTLVSGSRDRTVRLWDVATGVEKKVLKGHADTLKALAASADGKLLASSDNRGIIRIWEVATGRELATLPVRPFGAMSLCFAPDGRTLASGDYCVSLWDMAEQLKGVPGKGR
jgi:WD40 repeat protein